MNLNLARCLCSLTKAHQIFAYGCITMRQHVVYILDLSLTLTFDLYVDGGRYLSEFYSQFLSCLIQVHVPVILFCCDILTSIFACNLTVLLFCVARLASKSMISKGSRSMKQKEDKVSFFEESRALSDVVQKLHRQKVGEAHFCRGFKCSLTS